MPHFAHSGFVGISSGAQKEKTLSGKSFSKSVKKILHQPWLFLLHFVIAGRGRGL